MQVYYTLVWATHAAIFREAHYKENIHQNSTEVNGTNAQI
jgi:hypothetical protein